MRSSSRSPAQGIAGALLLWLAGQAGAAEDRGGASDAEVRGRASDARPAQAARSTGLAFEPCELRGSGGQGRVDARCATFRVAENPEAPDGRQIELFVARIPALAPEPEADAVTLINGGPGASSVALYVDLEPVFAALRQRRDIVVLDQRGTGRSAPLECGNLEDATYEFDPDLIRRATAQCLEDISGDPRYYTTSMAVEDLEALRRALGYETWNLYGVSYGTRVAQHYLRRYPDAVRTVTLDGVVPPGLALGPDVAINAQRTLDDIVRRCAAADYCASAFPDLPGQLERLSTRLETDPVELDIAHPVTGRPQPMTLTYAHLAMTLRLLSYAPETASLIPLIVREAAERENYVPLAGQALRIEQQLAESISFGMHNSVVCTEDVPFYADLEGVWPTLQASYLGADQVRALQTICELWPGGLRHDDLGAPLASGKPVLLLSGEHDPITPPGYAEQAAAGLDTSLHLVAPGQGHGVVARGCLPQVYEDFVDTARVDDLDADCVGRLAADAFFIDLLGPPP